jgi:hypothetical protein
MDILAQFWHVTPNLYDVKLASFITPELKMKKKINYRTITKMKIKFIPNWFIFCQFTAAYGTFQLHRYVTQEHKIHIQNNTTAEVKKCTELQTATNIVTKA